MKSKHWYDYLWIVSLSYLILGFFNILFAWLGLLCFFIPLIIAVTQGSKGYCNRYCGRGQLFGLLGGRLSPPGCGSSGSAMVSWFSFLSCSSRCSGIPIWSSQGRRI